MARSLPICSGLSRDHSGVLVGATHVAALSWKLGWLEGPRWPPSSDWKLVQALGLAGWGEGSVLCFPRALSLSSVLDQLLYSMALGSNRLRVEAEGLQTQVLEAPNITPTIFYQSKQVQASYRASPDSSGSLGPPRLHGKSYRILLPRFPVLHRN